MHIYLHYMPMGESMVQAAQLKLSNIYAVKTLLDML